MTTCPAFSFPEPMEPEIARILAAYPPEHFRSALLPLLDLAQRQCGGWLPRAALEHVAERLGIPVIQVLEVASFYSMFRLKPCGKHIIQVCRTTPCWLSGSDAILAVCQEVLGIRPGETTDDGLFTLVEVECLGACVRGPVIQVNDTYHEPVTPESIRVLLARLKEEG